MNEIQKQILEVLAQKLRQYPSMRVGQLIENASWALGGEDDLFFLQDEKLLQCLKDYNP